MFNNPETPVDKGKPVKFVAIPELGVPNAGVTKIGAIKFAFAFILADKLSVSLPMRLLNILAVSDNFNFVTSDESV